MKKENAIYIVQMDRFSGTHSYVLGVFKKKHKAQKAGEDERMYRGGNKYFPKVIKTTLDRNILDREYEKDYAKLS